MKNKKTKKNRSKTPRLVQKKKKLKLVIKTLPNRLKVNKLENMLFAKSECKMKSKVSLHHATMFFFYGTATPHS